MSFTLSGSTVIQQGTDTVVASSTVTGTTKSVKNQKVTVFDFGGKTLQVNGIINLDDGVAFHNLIMNSSSTGTLNLGTEKSNTLDYKYNYGVDILSTTGNSGADVHMNVYGQSLYIDGNLGLRKTSPILKFTRIHINGRLDIQTNNYIVENTHIIITNTFPSAHFVRAKPLSWENNVVDAEDTNAYFALSAGTPSGIFNFKGINLLTNQSLLSYGSKDISRVLNITNLNVGLDYTLSSTTFSSTRNFKFILNHEIKDTVLDTQFNPIADAVVYLDGGLSTTIKSVTNSDGELTQVFKYHENAVIAGSPNPITYIADGTITKTIFSYNHNVSPQEVIDVKSSQPQITKTSLTDDVLISQNDKSIVDAYTETETSQKLYDKAKAYRKDNYSGQTDLLITREGDTAKSNYNITIDADSAAEFGVVGNTITAKASIFYGNIETTGNVTLLNGAKIEGAVFSVTQDSFLREANGAIFTVYASEADRDARTNSIVSGVTNYDFLFSNLLSNPLYLWVTSGEIELPFTANIVQGLNEFDLGIGGSLVQISSNLKVINKGVQKASLLIPHGQNI